MMTTQTPLTIQHGEITTLTLNRPNKRNALDNNLIEALNQALIDIASNASIKLVIIDAQGPHFCAGADLHTLKNSIEQLATLFYRLHKLPQPTLARVQGAALGGGAGRGRGT